MRGLDYPVLIEPRAKADGGGYVAIVPDLLGCTSNAETPEGAVAKIQEAILAWIQHAKERGHAIPKPSRHHTAVWAALKSA